MKPKVDVGKIIGIKYFEILDDDNVESLSIRTYKALLSLFKGIMMHINKYNNVPSVDLEWKRKPYTRNDLEELATIKLDMSEQELMRRIRCTYYPNKPGPFIKFNGCKFEYNPNR